ncbi:MAG: lysophospholipid acyltransferase family protein [Neisseria sp.]|nr:lysophospholipid acyltransferase family protein [Neisseria sp.]
MNPISCKRLLARLTDTALCALTSFITGVRPQPRQQFDCPPEGTVYYANHGSHGDFVLVWISLPRPLRQRARPVAGADYWLRGRVRRFVIEEVFCGLLVDRNGGEPQQIIAEMAAALRQGDSLIVFPEGTRNTDDDTQLLPFKSGIYHLAAAQPQTAFVPVWLNNINRVLPKGGLLPVPLLCEARVGQAVYLNEGEDKNAFLQRSRAALLALAPTAAKGEAV